MRVCICIIRMCICMFIQVCICNYLCEAAFCHGFVTAVLSVEAGYIMIYVCVYMRVYIHTWQLWSPITYTMAHAHL